ncbi:glycoside hydrolase family 127 protein, partial [bacterium]|nr:glycoside hydrolase family 127 protein [bacterium]
LKNETLAELDNYVITRGVPLPPGGTKTARGISVVDNKGKALPCGTRILQKRPDGSVEWMLMDILVKLGGQEKTSIYVVPKAAPQPTIKHPVTVRRQGKLTTLSNGISEVVLSAKGGSLIDRLTINGKVLVDGSAPVDMEVVAPGGKIYRASLSGAYTVTVSHQNAVRTTVTVEGKHAARDNTTFLDFALRFTLTAGSADLKLEHTFYCREPIEGRIPVNGMRLIVPTTLSGEATKLVRQQHHSHDWVFRDLEIAENLEVVASSVGDIDNYAQQFHGPAVPHPCAGGSTFVRNMDSMKEDWSEYPFHMRPGQGSGFRAEYTVGGMRAVAPVMAWKQPDFTLVTTFEHFRQLHPKAIHIDENVITYSIWPEWSIPMQIVQGVSKSHIFWITGERRPLDMDEAIDVLGRWEYGYVEPVDISFDPAWHAYCQALECDRLLRYQPDKYPLLENIMEPAPAAGNPQRHTYDRQPATGMFHFGDIVSNDAATCSNNEDDMEVFFPLQHYLRTGQTYAWDYGRETARHYMEVDFCEWSTDPRQNGGLIPHTGQHFIGNVYSSHQWSEGLLAYYYLSGDERARNVVIRVAENHLYWVYNKIDVLASDGREAGMPLVNLAAAYRLTRDEKYIEAARHIIKNFFLKWEKKYGEFKYPYPQGTHKHPHKLITGYGDWSSFAGVYRLWELTGDETFRKLGIRLLDAAIQPGSFSVNDVRGMDFFAAWTLGIMTGDMEGVIDRVKQAIPMLLRRGGHPLRRLHFLKEADERGLINDKDVGNRAGVI